MAFDAPDVLTKLPLKFTGMVGALKRYGEPIWFVLCDEFNESFNSNEATKVVAKEFAISPITARAYLMATLAYIKLQQPGEIPWAKIGTRYHIAGKHAPIY